MTTLLSFALCTNVTCLLAKLIWAAKKLRVWASWLKCMVSREYQVVSCYFPSERVCLSCTQWEHLMRNWTSLSKYIFRNSQLASGSGCWEISISKPRWGNETGEAEGGRRSKQGVWGLMKQTSTPKRSPSLVIVSLLCAAQFSLCVSALSVSI